MDTFVVTRQGEYYFLKEGNETLQTKSGNLILNPEMVKPYAFVNGEKPKFLLTEVELKEKDVPSFTPVTILGFKVNPATP